MKVLLVDDEACLCGVLAEALQEHMGAEVVCALTAGLGARLLGENHVNLAVIDALLPDARGVDLARIVAEEDIPVLLTTGHPEIISRLEQYEFPYLAKPFRLNELRAMADAIMKDTADNIRRVKQAAARMQSSERSLSAALEQTRRSLEASAATVGNDRSPARPPA